MSTIMTTLSSDLLSATTTHLIDLQLVTEGRSEGRHTLWPKNREHSAFWLFLSSVGPNDVAKLSDKLYTKFQTRCSVIPS